jgi:hypothetical protein
MGETRKYRDLYADDPILKKRVLVVLNHGIEGFVIQGTESCSGCYEPGEYGAFEEHYPWDRKAQCRIGSGCHECGYRGKVRFRYWMPFPENVAAWDALMAEKDKAEDAA